MKIQAILFIVVFLIITAISGCTGHHAGTVVAKLGSDSIYLDEYMETYTRMNSGIVKDSAAAAEDLEEFLDLFVKFRLKLKDAMDSGLLEDPDVRRELNVYHKTLAGAYLIEREVAEPGIRLLYERRKEEIRASHILFRLSANASPEDTLKAYKKAMDVIEMLSEGESISDLAARYSEDRGAAESGGDIYYITGGMAVRPFEDAVYALQPGEITDKPVRSRYGYHIIKVTDRRPRPQAIRVSHIMKDISREAAPEDTLRVYNEMRDILKQIREGSDFAEMASKHSTDIQSARRRGNMGLIERGSLPRDFEIVAFEMESGEISDIVRTDFGYHIIKVTEIQPIESFEQMRESLRTEYQQRFFEEERKEFIKSLRDKYFTERYEDNINKFIEAVDTSWSAQTPAWHDSLNAGVVDLPLMKIDDTVLTGRETAIQIQNNPEFTGRRLRAGALRGMIASVEEAEIINREARGIENRYPEFARSMKEYRDGILIYYIEEKRIWNKIDLSEENLIVFYEDNKEIYKHPDLVRVCNVVVRGDSLANALYDRILAGEDMEEIAAKYNVRLSLRQSRGISELLNADNNEFTMRAFEAEIGEITEPVEHRGEFIITKTLERIPAGYRPFEEVRSEVTRDYQDKRAKELEDEWIESLKKRYRVEIYPEAILQALKPEEE